MCLLNVNIEVYLNFRKTFLSIYLNILFLFHLPCTFLHGHQLCIYWCSFVCIPHLSYLQESSKLLKVLLKVLNPAFLISNFFSCICLLPFLFLLPSDFFFPLTFLSYPLLILIFYPLIPTSSTLGFFLR